MKTTAQFKQTGRTMGSRVKQAVVWGVQSLLGVGMMFGFAHYVDVKFGVGVKDLVVAADRFSLGESGPRQPKISPETQKLLDYSQAVRREGEGSLAMRDCLVPRPK